MKGKTLWQLFVTFLKIGGFTFGGGYAMIPLIQKEAVEIVPAQLGNNAGVIGASLLINS